MAARDVHRRTSGAALAAALFCASFARAETVCRGRDLFPVLAAAAPEALAAIDADAEAMPFARGTLFRLTRADVAPSYVFGTLHLNDPRVAIFRPAVAAALDAATTLAVETVETGARLTQSIRRNPAAMRAALTARGDQRAAALLDPGDLAKLKDLAAAAGVKASFAATLKPAVLALLLDLPACARADAAHPYADALIADKARARGLAIVGLETIIEQTGILDGLPPEAERALLVATVRQAPYAEDVVETTIARYAGGETGRLLAWMQSPVFIPGAAGAETPPQFLDRLITQRNRRMGERLTPLLAKGGVFVAVGAAHLPGDGGLLHLMEAAGYTVEAVD